MKQNKDIIIELPDYKNMHKQHNYIYKKYKQISFDIDDDKEDSAGYSEQLQHDLDDIIQSNEDDDNDGVSDRNDKNKNNDSNNVNTDEVKDDSMELFQMRSRETVRNLVTNSDGETHKEQKRLVQNNNKNEVDNKINDKNHITNDYDPAINLHDKL